MLSGVRTRLELLRLPVTISTRCLEKEFVVDAVIGITNCVIVGPLKMHF